MSSLDKNERKGKVVPGLNYEACHRHVWEVEVELHTIITIIITPVIGRRVRITIIIKVKWSLCIFLSLSTTP